MQVSKSLQEVIMTFTIQKNKFDDLIKMMSPKGVGASTSQAANENNAMTIEKKDDDDIEVDIGDNEGGFESG